jgi:hypothetical protein
MDEKMTIPCDSCDYYCSETNECILPPDVDKPCKDKTEGANIGLGTLYDMNKNIMAQMPSLSNKDITNLITNMALSLGDRYQYYMLLNNEKHDYTVFNFCGKSTTCVEFREDFKECLCNRGDVLAIDAKDYNSYEIWLKTEDEEILCYYFFPYDLGVLEYA